MSDHVVSPRKRLLHVLLWCLAASAASGVLTVLIPQRDILWRVTAMGFIGALAIGLMFPLSLLVDRERFRVAGLFGIVACIVAFLLSTGLVWAGLGGWRLEERFGLSLVLVIFMSPAVVALLALRAVDVGRAAGLAGLICAAVATVLFLLQIWGNGWVAVPNWWKLAATAGSICWCGAVLTFSLIGVGQDTRHWRWAGVVAAIIGLIMWQWGLWYRPAFDPRWLVTVMAIGGAAAFANVLVRARVGSGQRLVVYGTIAAACAVAIFVILDVHVQEGGYEDLLGFRRFTAGASIVTISGTLAVIVLALLNRRAMRKVAYAARTVRNSDGAPGALLTSIALCCPRCRKEQTLPLGEAACIECRLIIHTRVEVPSCPQCGYDVSMLKADKCPECGAGIG
ncbi:MAG: zinc ribbon domain-containing protein [Phycisphaeraceae bacterium]|nr:zinc ribbon domain-containing protein [Phycisphaeraceae bacterium]